MKKTFAIILSTLWLVLPIFAGAEINPGQGWYLVPECARSSKGGDACTFNDVLILLNKALEFAVYLIIPLATVGILVTGIKLTLYGEAEKKAAKQAMQNILIGTFLTFAAYLIIDTILKWLVRDGQVVIPGS